MTSSLPGIKNAAADAQQRLGRDGLANSILAAMDGPADTRVQGGTTRCSVGSGRGPVVVWHLRDGELDEAAGITITVDTSATSGDFDLMDYHYDLDGTFRRLSSVDFSAYFRS